VFNSSLLGSHGLCQTRELLIDHLEVVQDALELPLADLESHLFRVFKVHLNVKHGLLHALLALARHLEVEAPVKVVHLARASEFILNVSLCQRGHFSHVLK
jgi:hypothetical protein